jgi:hypothetical protein
METGTVFLRISDAMVRSTMNLDVAQKIILLVAALLVPGGLIALFVGWLARRYAPHFARKTSPTMRARLTRKLGRVSLLQEHLTA